MMKSTILTLAGAAALLAANATAQTPKAAAQSGKAMYIRYGCYACHGYAGAGATTGPALAGRQLSADYIRHYVRAPLGSMPPYRVTVLPDATVTQIIGYILALPGAKPVSQVPQLARLQARAISRATPRAGALGDRAPALYAAHCAMCHGQNGIGGGAAPALLGEGKKRTAEAIAALIRNPPPAMPKLTPTPIPEADLLALARYVASFDGAKAP